MDLWSGEGSGELRVSSMGMLRDGKGECARGKGQGGSVQVASLRVASCESTLRGCFAMARGKGQGASQLVLFLAHSDLTFDFCNDRIRSLWIKTVCVVILSIFIPLPDRRRFLCVS